MNEPSFTGMSVCRVRRTDPAPFGAALRVAFAGGGSIRSLSRWPVRVEFEGEVMCQTGRGPAVSLQLILRDPQQLPVLQGGLMRHNAGDRHVQRHRDVNQRLPILQDGGDELVH